MNELPDELRGVWEVGPTVPGPDGEDVLVITFDKRNDQIEGPLLVAAVPTGDVAAYLCALHNAEHARLL